MQLCLLYKQQNELLHLQQAFSLSLFSTLDPPSHTTTAELNMNEGMWCSQKTTETKAQVSLSGLWQSL